MSGLSFVINRRKNLNFQTIFFRYIFFMLLNQDTQDMGNYLIFYSSTNIPSKEKNLLENKMVALWMMIWEETLMDEDNWIFLSIEKANPIICGLLNFILSLNISGNIIKSNTKWQWTPATCFHLLWECKWQKSYMTK